MLDYIFPTSLMVAAMVGALVALLLGVSGLQFTRKFPDGILQYYFYAVVFSGGIAIFFSTRNYAEFGEFMPASPSPNSLAIWVIRITSVIALVGSADQIARHFRMGGKIVITRAFLAAVFVIFWITSLAVPALFATHKMPFQLSWSYSLVLGLGIIYMGASSAGLCVEYTRNAIFVFCIASLLLIPLRPDTVLFFSYTQGFLPGLPRFAGLAPHPIVMGMSAAIGLWCLLAQPMVSRALNMFCWVVGLTALFLAQSKTVWFSFLVTVPVMWYYQRGLPSWGALTSSRHRSTYALFGMFALLGIAAAAGFILFGNVGSRIERFLSSEQGAQVLSLTGRDQIWAVALSEWARSPIFGYGLPLFGPEHQAQIGMRYATSGHNQVIDSLGRTGLVGATSTVIYALSLLWLGLRYGHSSRGLSAALALSITIRMVSEVPINLGNIGLESLPYYLLLAVIAVNLGTVNLQRNERHV